MPGVDSAAVPGASAKATWFLRGYVEDTLNSEFRKEADRAIALNATRARINLEGAPNRHLDFSVGVVGLLYSGETELPLADYLPEATRSGLFPGDPLLGLPGAASLLSYRLENRIYLQEAFGTLYAPHLKIRAGRQKFYTGNGFAYDPIDLLNRKDPLDPTYEVDGIDAVLAVIELPAEVELQALARLGSRLDRSDYLARIKTSLGGWDLALQYTHHVRQRTDWQSLTSQQGVVALLSGAPITEFERSFRWHLVGAEAAGELGGLGIHAQGGYAFIDAIGDAGTLDRAAKDHERLLIGIDYTFDFQLFFMTEYMRIGQGRARGADIDINDRMALFSGKVLSNNRDTLFTGVSFPLTDLSEIALYTILGFNDRSTIVNPWLLFDLYPGLRLSLAAYLPVGETDSQIGNSGAAGFARLRFSF